ncbi:Lysosomal/endosomal membrane protein p67 [Giardia duodenalis]|uniref:Lysosomal/endosomal membrane protein p67 n=1 Tax=Giardia intestinalis TaxID=5741 RepID=V6TV65_GIAIN|nr:Lysosomal/endosomal membrane protein p67 [Giardia intestinalis]
MQLSSYRIGRWIGMSITLRLLDNKAIITVTPESKAEQETL